MNQEQLKDIMIKLGHVALDILESKSNNIEECAAPELLEIQLPDANLQPLPIKPVTETFKEKDMPNITIKDTIKTDKGEFTVSDINPFLAVPGMILNNNISEIEVLPETDSNILNGIISLITNIDLYSQEEVINALGAPKEIAIPLLRMGYKIGAMNALYNINNLVYNEIHSYQSSERQYLIKALD